MNEKTHRQLAENPNKLGGGSYYGEQAMSLGAAVDPSIPSIESIERRLRDVHGELTRLQQMRVYLDAKTLTPQETLHMLVLAKELGYHRV